MPNANSLEEIISSPYSTPSQVLDAQAALYKIANPDRVTSVNLVPPVAPGTIPDFDWFSALGPEHDEEKWLVGAKNWLTSIEADPQFSDSQKDKARELYANQTKPQAQRFAEMAAIKVAWLTDRDARYAQIRLEHPSYSEVQVHNLDLDQQKAQGNVTWRTISGVPTKIRFDDKWETWELFDPSTLTDDAAARDAARRSREATARAEAKDVADKLAAAEPAKYSVPKVLTAQEQNMKDQEQKSIAWNRAQGLPDDFKPTDNKGNN
jgi:hypothetical protein